MFIGYRLLKVESKICVFCETSDLEIYSAFRVIYFLLF